MERITQRDAAPGAAPKTAAMATDNVKVKDMVFLCLSHWAWFALSLVVVMGMAVLYLKFTPSVYTRTASLLIRSDDEQSASDELLKDLGMGKNPVNITNEMLSLQSGHVVKEIVMRLGLTVGYTHDGAFHREVAYGVDLPVTVDFGSLSDAETASFRMQLAADGTLTLTHFVRGGVACEGVFAMKLGTTVNTPVGKLTVKPSPYYRKGVADELEVSHEGLASAMASVAGSLSITLRDPNSTIIDISYKDLSIPRAEDVLNTLVAVYNENWIKDRNQRTVSTNEFIRDRLGIIEQELSGVEQNISSFKSRNLMPDVQQMGAMAVEQMSAADEQAHELGNQIYALRYIRGYLTDGKHEGQLLPSNTGINSSNIAGQITEYNNIMLQRNNHLANSSAQNPLVIDLNQHLATLRTSIIQSLDNEAAMLSAQQRGVQANRSQAVSKIASNPGQAKYLLSVERQQKVKETLYLYLLQKREENELSQTFTAYNSQLIEPPHGSAAPTFPVSRNVLLGALALALAVPCAVIFMREWMNTSVRGRKDLEGLRVPFVGEIPLAYKERRFGWQRRRHEAKATPEVLVMEKSRNVMNEAFRVVRSNLEFILGFDRAHSVIMLVSMNPGSGKTFTTANLSVALGIKGKKVLAIDLDMRKGSLSAFVGKPGQGVSNFLSGQVADYRQLLVPLHGIDVLPCGTLPPNPTELLYSPRFQQMMDDVRQHYDYVFIDCPPVEVVADSAIINRHVDMTLFVVRAQALDRSFLPDIERWYEERKYKNLSILLNGTTDAFSHYGYHKYGYRYGYHYGKYGYAYGHADE